MYQLIARDIGNQLPSQLPDLDRYNKETRSNVSVTADQIDHLRKVMRGQEPLRVNEFRVTLHRGQVLAHYLAKRKKLAELKLRRQGQYAQRSPGYQRCRPAGTLSSRSQAIT